MHLCQCNTRYKHVHCYGILYISLKFYEIYYVLRKPNFKSLLDLSKRTLAYFYCIITQLSQRITFATLGAKLYAIIHDVYDAMSERGEFVY